MRLLPLALSVLAAAASAVSASPELAAPHLTAGQAALASGQYLDASRAFTQAFELDKSYVTLYKRATCYLSLGRNGAALDDFDTILTLNPSFSKAYLEKARVQIKEGDYDGARKSLDVYLESKPEDSTAITLRTSIDAAEDSLLATRNTSKRRKYDLCVEHAERVLDISPNLVEAREMLVECHFGLGQVDDGIAELTYVILPFLYPSLPFPLKDHVADQVEMLATIRRLAMLNPSSSKLSILVSTLSFFFVTPSQTLPQLKQCLHYDPDSSTCLKAHRLLKSLAKSIAQIENFLAGSSWRSAVNHLVGTPSKVSVIETFDETFEKYASEFPASLAKSGKETLRLSEPRRKLFAGACKALTELGEFSKAAVYCDETLAMQADDVDGLVGKAEGLMKAESWEEAVRVLERAFEATGRSSQDVANRLGKAQRLLKQSKAKDYYKILGVSRDADARTIKKAYRQAAKTAHPDKGGSEAKMAALNEAYEVLSNPELKTRFDNGDDPNDTSNPGHGGGGGGGNPFAHHGGNPFQFFHQQGGGGGFHQQGFKFQHGWN